MVYLETKLKEIEERCEKATPGPWTWVESPFGDPYGDIEGPNPKRKTRVGFVNIWERKNLEFAAHSRQDIPLLLKIIRIQHEALIKISDLPKEELCERCDMDDPYVMCTCGDELEIYRDKRDTAKEALTQVNELVESES